MAQYRHRVSVFLRFSSASLRNCAPAPSFLIHQPLRPLQYPPSTWRALSTFPGHGRCVSSLSMRILPRDDKIARRLQWQKRYQSSYSPEGPSSRPSDPGPPPIQEDPIPRRLTITLISLCAAGWAAFTWGMVEAKSHGNTRVISFVQDHLIANRRNWDQGRWWTAVTCAFCHADILHLGFNCYVLWSFGPAVIRAFGPQIFLFTWVLSSVTCYSASIYFGEHAGRPQPAVALTDSHDRSWGETPADHEQLRGLSDMSAEQEPGRMMANPPRAYGGSMGSSGAILGEITLFGFFFPRTPVSLFFIPIGIPLWALGGAFVAFESWCIFSQKVRSSGHFGHLGGMAGGAAAYFAMVRPWLKRI